MKFLVIIPARGGSKGIPNKNIIDVSGKPLIQYTIDLALKLKESKRVERVIVSTDCHKIADISRSLGAEIPFLRPASISTDSSKSIESVAHALSYYEKLGFFYDAVIILQPTSPLRDYEDLRNSLDFFIAQPCDGLISANEGVRRQEHDSVYIRNGAIYITKTDYIKRCNKIIPTSPLLFEMSKTNSINIDSHSDLEYLRNLL
jgi:N-acylneuraminate cytidylyltransferase/CMP-N,N'-diacetyllegionaminic acid synthase